MREVRCSHQRGTIIASRNMKNIFLIVSINQMAKLGLQLFRRFSKQKCCNSHYCATFNCSPSSPIILVDSLTPKGFSAQQLKWNMQNVWPIDSVFEDNPVAKNARSLAPRCREIMHFNNFDMKHILHLKRSHVRFYDSMLFFSLRLTCASVQSHKN